jgi:hypothetical protein
MPRKPSQEPYSVGKGKPPKEHQFKKGQPSPNPNGRPKGSTRESQLQKMLKKKVWVTDADGRRVRKPIQEIIDHKLVEAAASKGEFKAIKLIHELVIMHERHQRGRPPSREELLQEMAEEEQLREAQEKTKKWAIEQLQFMARLRKYGITEPGKGLASWVLEEAAKRKPDAHWARKYLSSELTPTQRSQSTRQPGSLDDWPT